MSNPATPCNRWFDSKMCSTKMFLLYGLVVVLLSNLTTAAETDQGPSKTQNKAADELTAETEVLGPLRVWHLVIIVAMVLVVIMVVVCCCFDFRIPRTRQEIEESYKKRQANAKYLDYLEKSPEAASQPQRQNNQQTKTEHKQLKKTKATPVNRPDRTSTVQAAENKTRENNNRRQRGRVKIDETILAEQQGMMATMSKKRQIGEAKTRPSAAAMSKVMSSLPRDSDDDARY